MATPKKSRKTRSDCTVEKFLEKNNLPKGAIRHPNGRAVRKDAKIGSLRDKK